MTAYRRPWWAIAMQLPAYKTTLTEEHHETRKQFIVEGEPVIRNFAWITYGPLCAVFGVVIMGILAWAIAINQQSGGGRIVFACAMFAVPALLWLLGGYVAGQLLTRFLAHEVAAKQERVLITVDTVAKTIQQNQQPAIHFADVIGFKLTADSGFEYEPEKSGNPLVHLMVETKHGQVKLLKKELGTAQQKQQLISKLNALLE